MEPLIDVIYPDGSFSMVSNVLLDALIATHKISAFHRSDGWVYLCAEDIRLRDYRHGQDYPGPERRSSWRTAEG